VKIKGETVHQADEEESTERNNSKIIMRQL
jgi:hypothetical protein